MLNGPWPWSRLSDRVSPPFVTFMPSAPPMLKNLPESFRSSTQTLSLWELVSRWAFPRFCPLNTLAVYELGRLEIPHSLPTPYLLEFPKLARLEHITVNCRPTQSQTAPEVSANTK